MFACPRSPTVSVCVCGLVGLVSVCVCGLVRLVSVCVPLFSNTIFPMAKYSCSNFGAERTHSSKRTHSRIPAATLALALCVRGLVGLVCSVRVCVCGLVRLVSVCVCVV